MEKSDDVLLSSFVDGELTEHELRELERRLDRDSQLQTRLDAMRAADAAIRKLYAEVDRAPMPDAVIQMLNRGTPEKSNVLAFPRRGVGQFLQMPVAIAASIALVVGIMVSELAQRSQDSASSIESLSARIVDPESGLYRLLEKSSSGEELNLGNAQHGRAVLTFADKDGRYCRQLRVDTSASSAHAVACRQENGWELVALAYTDAAPEGQFQPAAAETPFTITATVDGLIGTAGPVEEEKENLLISNGWNQFE